MENLIVIVEICDNKVIGHRAFTDSETAESFFCRMMEENDADENENGYASNGDYSVQWLENF